jgi:type I restriction enzyme M protein
MQMRPVYTKSAQYSQLIGITLIDDSVLSGPNLAFARDFIRKNFIVRGVISLPGDAFQLVGARAKTSILYLERRREDETGQPDIFMVECQYVGLDDVPMKTRASKASEARKNAAQEMASILSSFQDFMAGKKGPWLVTADRITDRLDVKYCLPRTSDIVNQWSQKNIGSLLLQDIVEPIASTGLNPGDSPDKLFTLLRVRYDGIAERGEVVYGKELTYSYMQQPQKDDIVVSNIAAALGSVSVIPEDLQDTVVSKEFTIMRVRDSRFHPWFLWAYLRSAEVRARLLSASSGTNRQRVEWEDLRSIPVPVLDEDIQKKIGEELQQSIEAVKVAERNRADTSAWLNSYLDLENPWAIQRLKSAKPPR